MKKKGYKTLGSLAKDIGLPKEYGEIAEIKAQLIQRILKKLDQTKVTHQEIAEISNVPRSAVTGILSGSLQKVSLERLIRILFAIGMDIEIKIKNAA